MTILNSYNWSLGERFTPAQVSLILAAGADLETWLNLVSGISGRDWILRHTQGTRVHHGGLFTKIAARITKSPTSLVLPYRDIWLAEHFDTFYQPKRHFLHELGHVVENRLPKSVFLPPTIFGGGASDRLTRYLGGKLAGLRYRNGTCGIPERFKWHGAGEYGNNSTADYFAEALSWFPYDLTALPDPLIADWFKREIFSN
jgi:hypothetical protein